MTFFIYQTLILFIVILSPLIIIYRILKNKEDKKRFLEKFTIFSKKRDRGNIVWFHASSVGEVLSIVPLIEKLENKQISTRLYKTVRIKPFGPFFAGRTGSSDPHAGCAPFPISS